MKPLLGAFALLPMMAHAQDYAQPHPSPMVNEMEWNLGLGLGIDHGGLGVQLQCRPAPPLVVFAGGGYALAGLGYNVGVQGRILPAAKWCPFVAGMYGYNAVIVVKGTDEYDRIYYGPSAGLGIENHSRENEGNFWRFVLIIPARPSGFTEDLDALKKNPRIDLRSEPPPFAISIAYHFGL